MVDIRALNLDNTRAELAGSAGVAGKLVVSWNEALYAAGNVSLTSKSIDNITTILTVLASVAELPDAAVSAGGSVGIQKTSRDAGVY